MARCCKHGVRTTRLIGIKCRSLLLLKLGAINGQGRVDNNNNNNDLYQSLVEQDFSVWVGDVPF
jgi:hypothetical protein